MSRKAYQITNSGIEAIGGGQVLFGEGKLDHVDMRILKVLAGEETLNNDVANQIEKRIHKLERKGYVMLVNV